MPGVNEKDQIGLRIGFCLRNLADAFRSIGRSYAQAALKASQLFVVNRRHQRSREKGSRVPDGVVCVASGKWSNPYETAYEFRRVLQLIRDGRFPASHLERPVLAHMKRIADSIEELRGKDLACWCSLDQPCHADVLAEFANR